MPRSRKPKGPHIPEFYRCANSQCTRKTQLLVSGYNVQAIPKDTPEDRIHRVYESNVYPLTIHCTCGHYTDVKPWREQYAAEQ